MANFSIDMNMVILEGHLSSDPEMAYTPTGKPYTKFTLATNHTWVDADGKSQSSTEFHRVTVWNGAAENVAQYLAKGRHVRVTGSMHYHSEAIKEGEKFVTYKGEKLYKNYASVNANNVVFLPNWAKREDGTVEVAAEASVELSAN